MVLIAFAAFMILQCGYWCLIVLAFFRDPTQRFMLMVFFLDRPIVETASISLRPMLLHIFLVQIEYFMLDLYPFIFALLELLLNTIMTIRNFPALIQLLPQYPYLFIEAIAIWSIFVPTSLYLNGVYSFD